MIFFGNYAKNWLKPQVLQKIAALSFLAVGVFMGLGSFFG
jgi:hypothetical protein